jgi:glycosyltransferase involved in cell wall biosynthesis
MKLVVVIPVYNHAGAIRYMVEGVLRHGLPCLLVDDGSDAECAAVLDRLAAAHPEAVICGVPQYDASVPKGRLYGRYLTHVWVWINTLSFAIRDSMCGFRLYPLRAVAELAEREPIGQRMDFDTEVLVRLYWRGREVVNLPTPVTYPRDGVSHFDVWRDNLRISRMHARLFFGMLLRAPRLLLRRRAR